MKKTRLLLLFIMICYLSTDAQETGTYKDSRDGKIYKTIKAGTQTWLAENLAFKTKKGCWAYSDQDSNAVKYGFLYIWETATNVCPSGWHLPSDSEWNEMINFAGGKETGAIKLKESGTSHWISQESVITNETGFTALPGGYRTTDGMYFSLGYSTNFWTSNADGPENALVYSIYGSNDKVLQGTNEKNQGLSIRCIKD